jgi:hypothetical protein
MNKILKITLISVILVVVSFLVYFFWPRSEENVRDTQRKKDVKLIQTSLDKYYIENNSTYPDSKVGRIVGCDDGTCVWGQPWVFENVTYMDKLVHDPLPSQSYLYTYQKEYNSYSIEACLENTDDKEGIKTDYTIWCKSGLVYKVESK